MDINARLIRAVQLATRKLAGTGDYNALLKDVLAICVNAVGASGGTIYLHDPATERLAFQHVLPPEVEHTLPSKDIPDDYGTAGAAFQSRQTQSRVFPEKPASERNPFELATGIVVRNMVATPLIIEGMDPIGVVQLLNKIDGDFNETDASLLDTIAAVSAMAYVNYRLTEESNRASTLLGMGKVSHDIGNLAASLYATVSFGEIAIDQLRESLVVSKVTPEANDNLEMLPPLMVDLGKSVDRIVGYSRLISDMSAGKGLRPNLQPGNFGETIRMSTAYYETEARSKNVNLVYDIEGTSVQSMYDDLYVFRIVQNLVGNALKAVREMVSEEESSEDAARESYGEVKVTYRLTEAGHELMVKDSGPGMPQEIARRILSGNARSQWSKTGGSGWGMKIVLELAAALKGEMSIDSELGVGSEFKVVFPVIPCETTE